MAVRINRYLALCGVAARRPGEELVRAGRVKVDGVVVRDLSFRVPAGARVTVDGRAVTPRRAYRYYVYYKPRGVITTTRDPAKRRTVIDALPAALRDLKPVGRLDAETEGLLLLTDDGAFAHIVAHPSFHIVKRYVVEVAGTVTAADVAAIEKGITLADGHIGRADVERIKVQGGRSFVTVSVCYGRKRMLRQLFAARRLKILSLTRVAVGPVKLGKLAPGEVRPLGRREIEGLAAAARRLTRCS